MPPAVSRDLINLCSNMPDKVMWILTPNGDFSCKSAWNEIRTHHEVVSWSGSLWHRDYIPRCSMIAWLACRDRLNTKDRLYRWGTVADNMCFVWKRY